MFFMKQLNYHLFDQRFRHKLLLDALKCKHYSSELSEFPEQSVQIQTCGNLYRKWKEQKLFSKVPQGDLIFKVPFIDTGPSVLQTTNLASLTVLALHGAPGSWRDFTLLSSYLQNCGCRVIAPSFPNFYNYRPGIFRHSDEEKAQYIRDFLTAISVSHVDLLICHSGATFPGLILCLEKEPKIKSLCLLNPGTFNVKDMRATRHFAFLKTLVKASENATMLKFVEICGPFILRNIMQVPVRFESVLDPLLSAATMVYGNVTKSKEKFLKVSQKLPILYIFSENDPLISRKPSYQLAECLGATSSDIFIYNSEGKIVQKGTATPMLKVLAFQQGSHYVFLKYPEFINREIANFLKL